MFGSQWSAEDEASLKKIAKKIGIDLQADDIAGEQATFATLEAAASKIGHAVTKHLLEDLALKQTELLHEQQPCPTCQRLCPVSVRDRILTTAEGPIELTETVCHCSACRRDFFPSTHPTETASTRL
jgi:hypothetical protein